MGSCFQEGQKHDTTTPPSMILLGVYSCYHKSLVPSWELHCRKDSPVRILRVVPNMLGVTPDSLRVQQVDECGSKLTLRRWWFLVARGKGLEGQTAADVHFGSPLAPGGRPGGRRFVIENGIGSVHDTGI